MGQRSKLIPNEKLIYERVDSVVYARYANRSDIPRWVISGESKKFLTYSDWNDMIILAENNLALQKQIDKLLNLYYILKDEK